MLSDLKSNAGPSETGPGDLHSGVTQDPGEISAKVKRTVDTYNKIGILIDDAPDAESRVARELYGTEVLPEWWHVVQSLQCGRWVLEALKEQAKASRAEGHDLLGILLMDRYLPGACGGTTPDPWDAFDASRPGGSSKELREQIHALATDVWATYRTDGRRRGIMTKFVTSYDRPLEHQFASEVLWEGRRLGVVRSLREDIIAHSRKYVEPPCGELLRFGAEGGLIAPTHPVSKRDPTKPIQIMQNLFKDGRICVLLSGWGMSESAGAHGPGLPLLSRFKDELDRPNGGERFVREPPGRKRPCICKPSHGRGAPRWSAPGLLEHIKGRVEGEDEQAEEYEKLCGLFGEYDAGFAYHHWLLARLPWSGIITTTCDGFHERSAIAVRYQQVIRTSSPVSTKLRTPFDWAANQIETSRRMLDAAHRAITGSMLAPAGSKDDTVDHSDGGLFKLYGRLFAVGTSYAHAEREIAAARGRLGFALQSSLLGTSKSARRSLVAVGMCKDEIKLVNEVVDEVMNDAHLRRDDVYRYWVDLEASDGVVEGWNLWPMTPLCFAYDLWQQYLRQL